MAKLDLKHAFRLCPVSPNDWDLLGMHWQGKFYVDLRLPFGVRSSPFLFNRLADAFEWILKNNYAIPALMHYLDDYFTVGPPLSPLCASQVQTMVQTADRLGIPLAPDKLEGPTTRLVFLGILIDSNLMESSLPPDKLSELLAELQAWSSRKKCIKRDLLSLIGKLNFACRIIPAGRIFLRRLIDLGTTARLPHHHISLNTEACRDVAWWLKFLPLWNGRAIIPDPFWSRSPDLELFTDASGGLGFGIYFQGHWLNGSWPPNLSDRSIQWKELYPIALACLLWGPLWKGKKLLFHCDNQSVVDIWAEGLFHNPCSFSPVGVCSTGHAPLPGSSASSQCYPLYFFSSGQFLTRDKVTSVLRLQLQRLGFSTECYASHSFRIGAATTAAEAGLPPCLIQTLGRWSSNCYTQYIRTPASLLQTVPAKLAATHSTPLQSWDPSTGQCRPFKL